MDYLLHVVVLIGVYGTLAISLGLLVGQVGMLSVAHAGFYGVGAYSTALLTTQLGFSAGTAFLAGLTLVVVVSLAVSLPSVRLHDDFLVITTLAFQIITFSVLNNWIEVTQGPLGVPGIPRPQLLGYEINSTLGFALLSILLAAACLVSTWRVSRSPFGGVLRAIKEDEVLVASWGRNPVRFKVMAVAFGAVWASAAGSLYAHYVTYVDPTTFTPMQSILILSMVIIGGAGSTRGALLGAAVLVIVPEGLRLVSSLPSSMAANLQQVLYGSLLVLVVLFRPRGLIEQD